MRKRLSNNTWYLPIIILASAGVMIYLSYMLRAISLAGRYGIVEAEIPILAVPLPDSTFKRFIEQPAAVLNDSTTLVMLSKEAFIFGTIEAFASDLTDVRSKFYVPHVEGAPNLPRLVMELAKWQEEIALKTKKTSSRVLILLPLEEIPVPIVIQCISALQKSGLFDKVIIGGGLV